jgi:membrane protease YdiL (CAAX protease family)
MKQLYSARNAVEAHDLRFFLIAHGVESVVVGDNNAFESIFSFTPQSAPSVFVDDLDYERAIALVVQFENHTDQPESHGTWNCRQCDHSIEAQFDTCWKCGLVRGDSPIQMSSAAQTEHQAEEHANDIEKFSDFDAAAPVSANRNTWALCLEMLIVLALTKPWIGGHSIATKLLYGLGITSNLTNYCVASILVGSFAVFVVLIAIRLSGESWSTFGITTPSSVDILTASLVCVIGYFCASMGSEIFREVLTSVYGERYVSQLISAHRYTIDVHGWSGLLILGALAVSVSVSEELVARGYLIPRLEQSLRSTPAAVLASAILFAFFHWYQGIFIICHAFFAGVVYGTAFAWTRRLWPVIIAHAVYDFSAFLHHAAR